MIRPDVPPTPPASSLEQGDVTLLTAGCIMQQLREDAGRDADCSQPAVDQCKEHPAEGKGAAATRDTSWKDQKICRPPRALDIGVDDWDHLFRAVEVRLKNTMEDLLAKAGEGADLEMVRAAHGIVFECMAALDYLHSALSQERDLQQQFEFTVFSAQHDLAQALGVLVDIPLREARNAMQSRTVASNDTPSRQKFIPYVPLYDALIAAKLRRRTLSLVSATGTSTATSSEGLRH